MKNKKCQVINFISDKISELYFYPTANQFARHGDNVEHWGQCFPIDLYIISDDDIEMDNYVINTLHPAKRVVKVMDPEYYQRRKERYFKIIATTDKSLELPQIPMEFIKKYIIDHNEIGQTIKEVMVEYDEYCKKAHPFKYCPDCYEFRGKDCEFKPHLNVNKDNTITISGIKYSWTREEVANLIREFRSDILVEVNKGKVSDFTENWIKNRL